MKNRKPKFINVSALLKYDVTQDCYFTWQISFVSSRCCSKVRVGGRWVGYVVCDRRADRSDKRYRSDITVSLCKQYKPSDFSEDQWSEV